MSDLIRGVYRRIYSGFIDGRRINAVSLAAEAWFWRLMVIADDHGNLRGDAEWLKAHAATRRAELTSAKIEALTRELVDAGLLAVYEVNSESFLNIPDWGTFQPAGKNGRRLRRFPAIGESGGIRVNPRESESIREILPSDSDSDSDQDSDTDTEPAAQVAANASRSQQSKPTPISWSPDSGWSGITDQDRTEWAAAYPACNLDRQFAAMGAWLRANPAKARKSNWRKFIANWLTRSQDKGGDVPPARLNGQPAAPYRTSRQLLGLDP